MLTEEQTDAIVDALTAENENDTWRAYEKIHAWRKVRAGSKLKELDNDIFNFIVQATEASQKQPTTYCFVFTAS